MADRLQLRCSSLPLAFKCAGSVRRGPLVIDEWNAAADMGTAAHEGQASLVESGRVDWDGVPELARRHGVDEKELRALLALASKLWEQLRDSFPNASTEVALSHEEAEFTLTGHVDVLGVSAGTAHVGDWKDGRLDKDFAEQLMGYCALVLITYPDLERATAGIMWVREQEFEHYSMGRHLLAKWLERLRTEVVRWDGTYRPGDHCAHCHRNHECEARRAVVRRDVEALAGMDVSEEALAALTPKQRIDLVIKARAVSQIAERVVGAIKADVVRNGDVEADGVRLTVQRTERRRLNVLQAFPILQEKLEDSEMAEVIDISIAQAEQLVAKKAGRGKGAGAVRALNQELAEAGAIEVGVTTSLVVRRAK
jgi:hypothetical protein